MSQEYWQRLRSELAALPIAPEEEPLPLRSTDLAECFTVRLTSVGPYRIFAYLSVPRGVGPFPVLYHLPRLGSVVEVLPQGDPQSRRSRYMTFSIAVRGQRNADHSYAAAFPGLLTDGVTDPDTYVFRGVGADVARGLEYLLSRPEVDSRRVVAVGSSDLAILLAGLQPGITHVVTQPGPFFDARTVMAASAEYPIEEFNDFLRAYPDQESALFHTLALFDPRHLAPRARARCLLWCGPNGSPFGPEWARPLASAIAGDLDLQPTQRSSYRDGMFQEEWLTRELGFDAPLFPEAWR
jgi:cephalosporin-C deacetylase-like acetyl esterase